MSHRTSVTATFIVSMIVPKGSNATAALEYLKSANATHGGGRSQEDAYFNVEHLGITARLIKKEITYV